MKRVYSKEQIEKIAKQLGFKSLISFEGYLANNYGLFSEREDEIEENDLFVEAEKEFLDKKFEELKREFDFDESDSKEEQIMKVICMIKKLNVDYLLDKYQGEIDRKTALGLVDYGYTHGNCGSLAYTLCSIFEGCNLKMFKAGNYGHQCIEYDGKIFDITGCSSIEEMKEFVALEGNVPTESCEVEDIKHFSSHKLLDFIITKYIKQDLNNFQTKVR